MPPSLDPLAVYLEICGEDFPALSFSEAGLTLPVDALRSSPPGRLGRGRRQQATLRLTSDESCDAYPVEIKLAGSSPYVVELAFSALPAQARLRMRHATGSILSDPDLQWIPDAAMDINFNNGETLPDGRRFALRTSAPLFDVTRRRRYRPLPPERRKPSHSEDDMPSPTPLEPAASSRLPSVDVLFLGALAILVTALLFIMGS